MRSDGPAGADAAGPRAGILADVGSRAGNAPGSGIVPAARAYGSAAEALGGILRVLVHQTGAACAFRTAIDEAAGWWRVVDAIDGDGADAVGIAAGMEAPLAETQCSIVVAAGVPAALAVADARIELAGHPAVRRFPRAVSYLGVPVLRPDGAVDGTLAVADAAPRRATSGDVELLLTLARLIATRIEAEAELRAREAAESALRSSEARFHAFMDHAWVAACMKDAAGRYVFANRAYERLFGVDRARLLGMRDCDVLPPAVCEPLERGVREVLAEDRLVRHGMDLPGDGGEPRVLISFGFPFADDGARYVAGVVVDVTERRRLEEQREALLVAEREYARGLEQLGALRNEFTSMIAHELQSPVAAIRNLAAMLAQGVLAGDDARRALETIYGETDALHTLIDDMRDLSALEREGFGVAPRPTRVADLVARAESFARGLPGPPAFTCTDGVPDEVVLADPQRIGQVLRNLLTNAVRYAPPRSPLGLRVGRDGDRVRFSVRDRGYGIAPEDLERIFGKFVRGDIPGGRRVPGAGLGLYVSRRIVQSHGDDLGVSSNPGEGSEFWFCLPLAG